MLHFTDLFPILAGSRTTLKSGALHMCMTNICHASAVVPLQTFLVAVLKYVIAKCGMACCRHAVSFEQWYMMPKLSRRSSAAAFTPLSRRSSSASILGERSTAAQPHNTLYLLSTQMATT
jgi:hypothetical protein